MAACSYGQVRTTYSGDTLSGRIKRMTEYTRESVWLKKSVYEYDSALKLVTASFYGENDTVQGRWLVLYDRYGRIAEKRLSGSDEGPCQKITCTYDRQGRKTEERDSTSSTCFGLFDWLQGSMSNWFTGLDYTITVTRYRYDAANRVAGMERESAMYGPIYGSADSARNREQSRSIQRTSYQYDSSHGKIAQTRSSYVHLFSGNGAPDTNASADTTLELWSYQYYSHSGKVAQTVRQSFRYTEERRDTAIETTYYKYDDAGRKTGESAIWKSEGSRSMDSARTSFRYDAHGHLIESIHYRKVPDRYARPGLGTIFASAEEYVYDSLNTQTAHHRYYLHRREDGTETKYRYHSWDMNIAEEKKEYDRQGNVFEVKQGNLILLSRVIEYY